MSLRRQLVPQHETEDRKTVYWRHTHDTAQSNKTNKNTLMYFLAGYYTLNSIFHTAL